MSTKAGTFGQGGYDQKAACSGTWNDSAYIRLRDNIQLNPNEYVIKIKGVEVAGGELMLDHYLAMSPGFVEEEIEGIKTTEPAFGCQPCG